MRSEVAHWAVVVATAQALFGCAATAGTATPSERTFARPPFGVPDAATIDVDAFSERVDLGLVPPASADCPSRGPAGAPVTIHLFSDFECPYCAHAVPVLREIEREFGGSVRTVWHNFPLPNHPHAELAAVAGMLVYRTRGGAAFWRFHDALFDAAPDGLDETVIHWLASREGVPPATLVAAEASGVDGRLAAEIAAAERAGIEGTPAFLVNDRRVTGVIPYAAFRALVLVALSEAQGR
jgi:protein-disulfide isomerase